MFEYLRPGYAAFLIDMSDHQHGRSRLFGKLQHGCAAFAHLSDAARRRFGPVGKHRLDGIDDQKIGLEVLRLYENLFEIRFAIHMAIAHIGVFSGQTVGTHL